MFHPPLFLPLQTTNGITSAITGREFFGNQTSCPNQIGITYGGFWYMNSLAKVAYIQIRFVVSNEN